MEQNKIESAKMLMSFYNSQAGTSYRLGDNERKINIVVDALERANGDVRVLKNHIREYVAGGNAQGAMDCFERFIGTEKQETTTAPTEVQVNNSLGILEQAVVGLIAKTSSEKIESEIMGNVEQTIRDFIKEEYGTIERRVSTVINGVKKDLEGIQHEKFDTVLKFVANDEPVFLTGPAGSGKNHLCKNVAKALGLNFYFTNAVTQEYKLTGFTDAMGTYQPTQFYKAFTEGGLFMLDEMDASIPEVLVILNAAIANRYFDFPAPIGYVEAHPDFRVIAAGNTVGQGASCEYVGRNQLDGASLDRFALVEINYSEAIENNMANGDLELANFCRDYRKSAMKAGQQVIVSYRAISRLAKMIQIMSLEEALQTCLVKGTEKDDLNIIISGINRDSKYKTALKNVVNGMTA